jgi:hypothetical protein
MAAWWERLDPYEVLSLHPGATAKDAHNAYHRLVRERHSDHLPPGATEAQRRVFDEELKRLNWAYEQIRSRRASPSQPNDDCVGSTGSVRPQPVISPDLLSFGQLAPGESRERTAVLHNRAEGSDAEPDVVPATGLWFRLASISESPDGGVVLVFRVRNDAELELGLGCHEAEVRAFLDEVSVPFRLRFEAIPAATPPRPSSNPSPAGGAPTSGTTSSSGTTAAPSSRPRASARVPDADQQFWQLWLAGSLGPLGFGIILVILGNSSPLVGWTIAIGALFLLVNAGFALSTEGYRQGEGVAVGIVVARTTGWVGAGLIALVVIVAAFVVVLVVMAVIALFAGLGAAGQD